MSKCLELYLVTDKSPRNIIELAAKVNCADVTPHLNTFGFSAPDSGIWAGEFGYTKGSEKLLNESKEIWQEAYGFIPTVSVYFRFYPNQDIERKLEGIKKSVTEILKCENGNAVFIDDIGITVFERIDGEVFIADTTKTPIFSVDQLKEEFEQNGVEYKVKPLIYRNV
jgi:hypothetical protein